jgi:hypothetical protein
MENNWHLGIGITRSKSNMHKPDFCRVKNELIKVCGERRGAMLTTVWTNSRRHEFAVDETLGDAANSASSRGYITCTM